MAPRKANGHATELTHAALAARIEQTNATLKALLAERQGIALASVAGDHTATSRIREIDRERASLEALCLTLKDARRALHDQERAVEWRRFLPHAKRVWRTELRHAYDRAAPQLRSILLGRQSHDIASLRLALEDLEALEREAALTAAANALPDSMFNFTTDAGAGFDRGAAMRSLQAQRARLYGLVADALLEEGHNVRPPEELEQALVDARHRLAVAGVRLRTGASAGSNFIGVGR